jgi:alpha-methylacyl-CoA racemase
LGAGWALAQAAGHDIDYVALTGILGQLGRPGTPPPPPLNVIGDFGGGAMFLVVGVLAALTECRQSGRGQVVDAAMIDGASLFTTMLREMQAAGEWSGRRGHDFLNGGAHFYDVYETADSRHVAVGAIEPEFYTELLDAMGVEDVGLAARLDPSRWDELRDRMATAFRQRTRDEWCQLLEGTDACFAPVLDLEEATTHPHNVARGAFVEVDGVLEPAPAPRFSRTPTAVPRPAPPQGADTRDILVACGFAADEVEKLVEIGAVGTPGVS